MRYSRSIQPVLVVLLLVLILAAFILDWTRPRTQPVEALPPPPRSTDMAVIGATTAALLTALQGAQNGAQVYLFPQGAELGEDAAFLLAEGLAAAGTPPQRELAAASPPEEAAEPFSPADLGRLLREWGGNLHDPALLSAFIQFVPRLYPLLESTGISFTYIPDPDRSYLHLPPAGADPAAYQQHLKLKVMQAGVIISNDRVKELLFSPQGEIKGLLLLNSWGREEVLRLRSVVLADGGYSGNLLRWHPYLPYNNLVPYRTGQEGWGLSLAAELGMDVLQTGFYRRRVLLFDPSGEKSCLLLSGPWEQSYLFNNRGQLLAWYAADTQEIFNFIHASPPGAVYLLAAPESIPAVCAPFFRSFADREALAEFCGGALPPFPPPFAATEPHAVAPVRVGVDYTPDGLAITPRGEVKRNGMAVPGLYAAGEICGGLHGAVVLPGMPLSETLFLAAVAGEAAAHHAWK